MHQEPLCRAYDVSLADPEYRKRIDYDRVAATPAVETRKALAEECVALVEADDWLALSGGLSIHPPAAATAVPA